jgi:hypothetical protein
MAPWKMVKVASESSSQNIDVLSNTSSRALETIKTWMQVCDILQYELSNCLEESDYEGTKTQKTKIKYVAQSELHKIAM